VPFYGPAPAEPTFANTRAAVLAVFAELDNRVNAGRDALDAALTARGLTHEMVTVPGVDLAFFNDTGPRFNAAAAAATYQRVLDWFGRYLTTGSVRPRPGGPGRCRWCSAPRPGSRTASVAAPAVRSASARRRRRTRRPR
jgi:hypothetical protein